MRCMTTADEKGMMAALETVNDSVLKMTSTLTQLSRKSFNNLMLYQLIMGPVVVIPSLVSYARPFYVRSLLGHLTICQLVMQ